MLRVHRARSTRVHTALAAASRSAAFPLGPEDVLGALTRVTRVDGEPLPVGPAGLERARTLLGEGQPFQASGIGRSHPFDRSPEPVRLYCFDEAGVERGAEVPIVGGVPGLDAAVMGLACARGVLHGQP